MPLPVIYDSIPDEMKRFPNWVLWRLEERDGKNTKIPYQRNGKRADTTNPDTWDKYDYIESTRAQSDGIGFVFSEDTGIIGIDWDKVRDLETGEWDEEILEEIKSMNSYAELSQSGTGAHVLIKGIIPGIRRRKGNIEMYSKERFFVVTGQHIEGVPTEIKENQEAINKLYKKRFGEDKKEEKKSIEAAKETGKKTRSPKMTDEEVLDHCRKAANSEKFIKLYDNGEWKEFNYPSQSEADFALCFMLAFYTQDEKQLDRIFRKGALYREDRNRTSKYTLDNVLNQLTEVYNPENKGKGKSVENGLSNRGREVLNLAFKKMLDADNDKARQKNGEGFNKFDSEAIHNDMDGAEEISDDVLIKHAHRLKKYKKQLTELGIDTDELEDIIKEYNKKSKSDEPKKINVPFDVVAEHLLTKQHIFSMRDNKQIYLYQDGVYKSDGTEAILDTEARNIHNQYYYKYWNDTNPGFTLGHIPKATTKYVNEALAYIRAYSHRPRSDIDEQAAKYINLQNGLFDLEKWEKIDHTHEYLSICQIPVKYDPNATCPQIEKFISEVAKPEDIDFIYEWFGYCLTVDVKYQKALMVYGIPGTGKSVLLTLLEMFIGIENCSAESLQKIEEDKYRSANLFGKRVNVCSDIPSTKMHKTEVFKKLVSGLDTIDAENKYQQSFKFRNVAKLAFSANKLPEGPKDPAFYERFCLVEFGNKFRGTDKDDKTLITKLTEETELSGLLNLALKGLKRLYENDKFSYSKTFEETEKEYLLNSNPVAVFIDECTITTNDDIDSTLLYASYVNWSGIGKRPIVSKIEFGRQLGKMGYTNYRENVKKDGSKKATYWENIRLLTSEEINKRNEKNNEKTSFGQDLGQDQKNISCPIFSCQPLPEVSSKNAFGQDPFSYVDPKEKNNLLFCENIETVEEEKKASNESKTDRCKTSCPSVCFFDSGKYGQDGLNDAVRDPVREQKTLISEQLDENNIIKKIDYMQSFRRDLKNLVSSRYNSIVESIPELLEDFNRRNPGYRQLLGEQALLEEAEKINKWGWN